MVRPAVGRFPEMQAKGVNLTIGTDGNNNSNYHDLMRATYLLAGLFKDARRDPSPVSGGNCTGMRHPERRAGAGPCRPHRLAGAGKKADFVAHDTWRPNGARFLTSSTSSSGRPTGAAFTAYGSTVRA